MLINERILLFIALCCTVLIPGAVVKWSVLASLGWVIFQVVTHDLFWWEYLLWYLAIGVICSLLLLSEKGKKLVDPYEDLYWAVSLEIVGWPISYLLNIGNITILAGYRWLCQKILNR